MNPVKIGDSVVITKRFVGVNVLIGQRQAPIGSCIESMKGPDLTKLDDFEKIQPQLLALAATAITHPAVTPPRRPDRTFLVSNAVLTPPVRDRIEKFNAGNASLGYGPIEPIERDQLVTRFLAAHGKYLPEKLPDIRTLIELYYSEPEGVFPARHFAKYLEALLPFPPLTASRPELKRATASIALLTAYATSSWVNANNHLAVAQAWLTTSLVLVRFADATALSEELWKPTYDLALMSARTSLAALSKEAADSRDLIVPDLVEGLVYPARVVLVGGYLSSTTKFQKAIHISRLKSTQSGSNKCLSRWRTGASSTRLGTSKQRRSDSGFTFHPRSIDLEKIGESRKAVVNSGRRRKAPKLL